MANATSGRSVEARRAARRCLEEEQARFRRRQAVLTELFETQDSVDELSLKVAKLLDEAVSLGESRKRLREAVGLSTRQLAALLDEVGERRQNDSGRVTPPTPDRGDAPSEGNDPGDESAWPGGDDISSGDGGHSTEGDTGG